MPVKTPDGKSTGSSLGSNTKSFEVGRIRRTAGSSHWDRIESNSEYKVRVGTVYSEGDKAIESKEVDVKTTGYAAPVINLVVGTGPQSVTLTFSHEGQDVKGFVS